MGPAPAILVTERLVLRPMEERDVAFTAAVLGDLEVARRLKRIPHPYTEAMAREWLATVRAGHASGEVDHFMIALRGGEPVGAIGLHADASRARAETGYWIAPAHWNRGYAREALAAVVRHAFHGRTPPVEVLQARAHRANTASVRVLEACGFIEVGPADCRSAATGEAHASALYELRRD